MKPYEMERVQLDVLVRDGTSACEARVDFVPMASVEGDCLRVFHGVRFSTVFPRFPGSPIIASTRTANDLSAEIVERLRMENLVDGVWRRSTSPRTALAALDGYKVEVVSSRLHEALWSPEVIVPRFVQAHLRFTSLMMGMLPLLSEFTCTDEVEDRVDDMSDMAVEGVVAFVRPPFTNETSFEESLVLVRNMVEDLAAVTRVDVSVLGDT